MIDPKFNALPEDAQGDFKETAEESVSGGTGKARKPRPGLSINDTVAASANLSVGSRGVDTSGSSAGAGAGAGMTYTTPGDDGSPAPSIVPGARSSGTTPRGETAFEQTPATRMDASEDLPSIGSERTLGNEYAFTNEEISAEAYDHWHERGQPHGSPEEDWERAINRLREKRERERRSGTSA